MDRDRRGAYGDAIAAVREVVDRFDPIGLRELGAPYDEYDPEVADLVRLVMRPEPFDEEAVDAVWRRWFGDDYSMRGSDQLAAQTRELRLLQARFGGVAQ